MLWPYYPRDSLRNSAKQNSPMKSWIIFLLLFSLVVYSNGRTRFSMVEFDEAQEINLAYKFCIRQCTEACLRSEHCHRTYDKQTLCMNGAEDDKLTWPGFSYQGRTIKACSEINAPVISRREPKPEPKQYMDPYELLRLMDMK